MWRATTDKKFGVAIYNFDGNSVQHGLSLDIGESVQILEETDEGWLRGFSTRRKHIKGIFPLSYIHLKKFKVDYVGKYEVVTPLVDPIVGEITSVLREWGGIWKRQYIGKDTSTLKHGSFTMIRQVMMELIDLRRQFVSGDRTQEQIIEMKKKATSKIDWGNSQMGLDLVPRIDYETVDLDNTSVVELFKVHLRSREETQSSSLKGTVRKKKKKEAIPIHHLYCVLEKFECHIGEDAEIFLSLYDAKQSIFISERFLTKKNKNEVRPTNLTAIFTDLGADDLSRDLYLVVQVIRVGRMLYKENEKKKSDQVYRRPYGCGAISISDILSAHTDQYDDELKQYFIKVYCCLGSENDFSSLHDNIIKKQTNKVNVSNSQIPGIPLNLKMLHGDIKQVKLENALLFAARGMQIVRKLGFADVIMPGDARNDVYITMERGEFEKGGKSVGKNVEVSMKVFDSEGYMLKNSIKVGEGAPPRSEYNSYIYYHCNVPRWNETIKLAVPPEKVEGSHVRFEFRHCSNKDSQKKLYAFAFSKLTRLDGAIIPDGTHELYVYKCDDSFRFHCDDVHQFTNVNVYLNLPSCQADMRHVSGSIVGNATYLRNLKESFFIRSRVCSTKLSQNLDLVALLKWKENPQRIHDILQRFLRISGEDIVKCQDIIDTLFNILDDDAKSFDKLVFQALVFIIGILSDIKYRNLRTDLDTYIEKHFAATLAHRPLISCLRQCAEDAVNPNLTSLEKQQQIRSSFRALHYLFKFIIQSRLLYERHAGGLEEKEFKTTISELFLSMNTMVSQTAEHVLSAQITLLGNFSTIYDSLTHDKGNGQTVFTSHEVATYINNLINNVAREFASTDLHAAKLRCMIDTVNGRLFEEEESRSLLLPVFLKHIQLHLMQRQELKLCAELLGDVLSLMQKMEQKAQTQSTSGEIGQIVHILLDNILQTLLTINRQGELAGPFVACFIAILKLMREEHFKKLLSSFSERKPLKEFITRIFMVFKELVKQDVFPSDWMGMRMVTNNVILLAIPFFSQILTSHFLDNDTFDSQLWSSFFHLSVSFLTQPCLQLETFSEVKRNKIKDQYGDMRVLMGFEIVSMWQNLGDHKISFLSLIGSFLEVTLVPETELRRTTLPIFYDIMECEQKNRGNFKQVESEVIDKLDLLVGTEKKGDEEYKTLFYSILSERLQDQPWKETGLSFVKTVAGLLVTLLDYRTVMMKDEKFKQMSCTMNILNFYKDELKKEEMYKRYIYKLHDLHIPDTNYAEAAFTLLTLANSLKWSAKPLQQDEKFPKQTEWQRKESLYVEIIDLLDRGKTWEHAVPLCKELAVQYETKAFDYAKLSKILNKQALFFDHILNTPRLITDFYRISFYGSNFPTFLRDKSLVLRAREYERADNIIEMIRNEFPRSELWTKHKPPDLDILQSSCQYIEVRKVNPIPNEPELFRNQTVPDKIMRYYEINDVRKFYADRPFHKGEKDPNNELKSMWLERTTITTSNSLPGILRWFEVIDKTTVEISPIENALETMNRKNKELRSIIATYSSEEFKNISPLSMSLNGVIDAAVMGGIAKYQEAYFIPEYIISHPQDAEKIENLKKYILEQLEVLECGLRLHGELAPPDVKPLHAKLEKMFASMKASISSQGSPITGHKPSPLPKQPVMSQSGGPPPSPFTPPEDSNTSFQIGSPLPTPLEPKRPVSVISTSSTGSNDSTGSGGSAVTETILEADEEQADENTVQLRNGLRTPRRPVPILPYHQRYSNYTENIYSNLILPLPSTNFPKMSVTSKTKVYGKDMSAQSPPKVPKRPSRLSRLSSEPTIRSSSPTTPPGKAVFSQSFDNDMKSPPEHVRTINVRNSWAGVSTGSNSKPPQIPPRPSTTHADARPLSISKSFKEEVRPPDVPIKQRDRSRSVSPPPLPPKPLVSPGMKPVTRQTTVHGYSSPTTPQTISSQSFNRRPVPPTPTEQSPST